MRKNRRVSKRMSVMAATSMRFGAVIVVFCVMVILNILSSSSCTQLLKVKRTLERELAKQEDACMREATRWEEMLSEENIEKTLRANGLSMKPPKPYQVVHMRENGLPRPGQMSVTSARRRLGGMSAANTVSESPSKPVSRYARRKVRQ